MQKTAENITSKYENDKEGRLTKLIDGENYFIKCEYDGLGNVKSQVHGYGVFGSGKKYYGFNAEQYNPVTGNQNLRNRQVNIRRQRFLTEDTYLGNKTDTLSINRYIYARNNPLKYLEPSGYDYIGAMYLNSKRGAGFSINGIGLGAGHAAILLIDDEGQGEFYSYAARNNGIGDQLQAVIGSQGYLSTVVDENGKIETYDVNKFFNSKGNYDKIQIGGEPFSIKNEWVIEGSDAIDRQNIRYELDKDGKIKKDEDSIPVLSKDVYTDAIYIPVSNEEGIAMHDRAMQIRKNPGTYGLTYHNCNQVAQDILSAGGKNFATPYYNGSVLETIPNVIKTEMRLNILGSNIIDLITGNTKNKMMIGRIGDFQFKNGCISKR